jgi:hypothetical protein
VHGDDAVEARAPPAPDEELLVVEGLQVGLGQRCVDLYTLTLPGRVEAPVAPRATPPFEPELVPLVFEVSVSGVRSDDGCVAPEPPVLAVGAFGIVPAIGTVLVPVGAVPVGVVGVVVVGMPVVVVPVAGGVPGVVADGVVVVDGVVVLVVGLPAGSLFMLSGSTTSEIGRGRRRMSVVVGVLVLVLVLPDNALAVIWGRCAGAVATAASESESGVEPEPPEAVGGATPADAAA